MSKRLARKIPCNTKIIRFKAITDFFNNVRETVNRIHDKSIFCGERWNRMPSAMQKRVTIENIKGFARSFHVPTVYQPSPPFPKSNQTTSCTSAPRHHSQAKSSCFDRKSVV